MRKQQLQKGEPMEEIKIREDKLSLNGYAEVKLTLLAKLV